MREFLPFQAVALKILLDYKNVITITVTPSVFDKFYLTITFVLLILPCDFWLKLPETCVLDLLLCIFRIFLHLLSIWLVSPIVMQGNVPGFLHKCELKRGRNDLKKRRRVGWSIFLEKNSQICLLPWSLVAEQANLEISIANLQCKIMCHFCSLPQN